MEWLFAFLSISSAFADGNDTAFTVAVPSFDWSVLASVACSIITVGAGMLIFRVVMRMLKSDTYPLSDDEDAF